ncbi:MAG: glycosyltransferase family 87 protein [Planctomycetota bacterium]|nr:glycosyltransferase family 87 protein [Planctomycetota bacterium]
MPTTRVSLEQSNPSAGAVAGALAPWGLLLTFFGVCGILVSFSFAKGQSGDFFHFYWAAKAMADGQDIYTSGHVGYIYPPLIAFVFQPLTLVGEMSAAWIWFFCGAALTLASMLILVRTLNERFRCGLDWTGVAWVAFLGLMLTADKVRWELELGQTDSILLLCLALALRWMDSKPILCGVALGFAANVKYLSLVALPYLVVRGRWLAAASTLASFVVFLYLPALGAGWTTNAGYVRRAFGGMVSMMGESKEREGVANVQPLTWLRSVSIPSFFARLLGEGSSRTGAMALAAATGLAILAGAWAIYARAGIELWRAGQDRAERWLPRAGAVALEWAGIVVVALTFSPQTTTRHMYLLLVPHAVAAMLLLVPRRGVSRVPVVLAMGLMLAALNLPPGGAGMDEAVAWWRRISGPGWCALASYLLLLWTGLHYARAAAEERKVVMRPGEPTSRRVGLTGAV